MHQQMDAHVHVYKMHVSSATDALLPVALVVTPGRGDLHRGADIAGEVRQQAPGIAPPRFLFICWLATRSPCSGLREAHEQR